MTDTKQNAPTKEEEEEILEEQEEEEQEEQEEEAADSEQAKQRQLEIMRQQEAMLLKKKTDQPDSRAAPRKNFMKKDRKIFDSADWMLDKNGNRAPRQPEQRN